MPGRRARLHDHRERTVELARHRGEVPEELVDALADDAAAVEVGEDRFDQIRTAQESQRFALGLRRHRRRRSLRRQLLLDELVLQRLERQVDLSEILPHDLLLETELDGRLVHVGLALPRGDEIDRIDEDPIGSLDPHQHLEFFVGEVLQEAAHLPPSLAERQVEGIDSQSSRGLWGALQSG